MEEMSTVAQLVADYGFPTVMVIGLGYFVYFVYSFISEHIDPAIEKMHFQLITKLSSDLGLGGASIGMSSDYLEALNFNPQYIRLGTVLFGKRV